MNFRVLSCCLALAVMLPGCASHDKKPGDKPKKAKSTPDPAKPHIADMSRDVSFQSFLGRLRIAVRQRDRAMITSLSSPDFGWRWDTPPLNETVFEYWDKNNLWPELEKLLAKPFGPSEDYMVSPPEFIKEQNYKGYRCGIQQVNGSWRFAYFITGEDVVPL